jgi:hypothetical protein
MANDIVAMKSVNKYNLSKLTMVFSFYLTEDFRERRANKLHFFFLNRYSHIFEDSIITILADDINNTELINDCKKWFIDCIHSKNVTFKVTENDYLCETKVFINEIASQMGDLYGLYFFGHNKGVTNYIKKPEISDDIDLWIIGLYYFNLNFMDEVKEDLLYKNGKFYGAFMMDVESETDFLQSKTIYSGTFFWCNPSVIYHAKNGVIPIISQRGYVESVFPIIMAKPDEKFSHKWKYVYHFNQYGETRYTLETFFLTNDEEKKEFFDIYEEIKTAIPN